MTVTETTSTNGNYKVFSIDDTRTLSTAIAALINELEQHNIPLSQVRFITYWNQSTGKPALIAICRRS